MQAVSGGICSNALIRESQGVLPTKDSRAGKLRDEFVCEQEFIAIQQPNKIAKKGLAGIIN
ncbi:MAG: hypothetical protein ABI707_09620 [Ferruginibacter sp.]